MAATDQDTLRGVAQWLTQGRQVWLCTVMQTWELSPRPVGTLLAMNEDDECAGPGLKGSLEEALLRQARRDHPGNKPVQVHHSITEADHNRFHLPSGSEVLLLVEPLQGAPALENIQTMLECLDQRQRVTRSVGHDGMGVLESSVFSAGIVIEHQHVLHTLLPGFRLLLVGAGEVARALALQAAGAGFEVSLCEPRGPFQSRWDASIAPLLSSPPEKLITDTYADRYCAVLALAQEASLDDRALIAALEGEAFFVGALGDARVSAIRRQRLHEQGVSDPVMARLHSPLGFEIGSRTPGEIAVAAMAQMLSERYRLFLRPDARR